MIPPQLPGLKWHPVCVVMVLLLVPAGTLAQAGVTLKASVSDTIALSLHPNSTHTDVVATGNIVRLTIAADQRENPVRVPLLVRSNSSFKIAATVESETNLLTQLSVTNVRSTGRLVSPEAVTALHVPPQFDRRGRDENISSLNSSLDLSCPFLVANGPRVSLGGTLNSPTNALEITLLIRLHPELSRGRLVHLTFAATADQ